MSGRLVEARLGRPPQDILEAAVVLEAWAGMPAQSALDAARELLPLTPSAPLASAAAPVPARRPPGLMAEGAAFLVAVAAVALWAGPLTDALGAGAVERALALALPLTLALQWGLRARRAAPRPAALVAGAAAAAVLAAATGPAAALAGSLTLVWTGGTLLIRRGWPAAYAAGIGLATAALLAGLPALGVVAATAAAIVALLVVAPSGSAASPGRWSGVAVAGLIGAGLGILLVADPSARWIAEASPALALAPSALGGFWASWHLWRLPHAFPAALTGVPVIRVADGPAPAPRRTPARVVGGAAARLLVLTAAASLAVAAAAPVHAGILAGFGLLALATLLAGLLESLGRPWAAVAGVGAGVAGELLVALAGAPFAGAGLVAGGTVAVLALAPWLVAPLARPALTLATALWIT